MTILCILIQRHHLLMALLAMEAMILTLVLLMLSSHDAQWTFMIMIMLTFGACEAGLGLACMVSMARSYGNDHLTSLSINKC
uniref:NADH-ubiquinone oxidoreductase chain 4L n=1 Tax=Namalycastis abiuma TaxID=862681 RepID=A0A342K7Z2_9ANNE|nr:NADH dehydrogenase subunit 4L [Namalycastis abiuma]AMY15511.1 NADH dehydrogenase subunit 4L [Namalycastis abiuma]